MRTNDTLKKLLPGTPRSFKPKTPIIYQGEAPRNGYYITSGLVKAYTLQDNGEEQIVAFLGPGDFFPLSWLFEKTSSSIYYYETLENCHAISVTRQDIKDYIWKNTEVKDALLDRMIEDQTAYLMRITALEQSRAVEKILFTLYYLMYQFGAPTEIPDEFIIETKLTHATIAALVGLTRETTATELNKLKKKEVLSYSKKQYRINKTKLERTVGEDGFTELMNNNQ